MAPPRSRYQRQFGGGSERRNPKTEYRKKPARLVQDERFQQLESKFGVQRFEEGSRRGWLYNIAAVQDTDQRSVVLLYFLGADKGTFCTEIPFRPYFYVVPNEAEAADEIQLESLRSRVTKVLDGLVADVQIVHKQDLDQPNHLRNVEGRVLLQCSFENTTLMQSATQLQHPFDVREHDVQYIVRACTDLDIRVGTWFTVTKEGLSEPDIEVKAEPTVLAFDIECTKPPLKFPNAEVDEIFMISYMVAGKGFLIVSRSVVGADIEPFEYTPKPQFPGHFTIFNEPNEKALLDRFFQEFRLHAPHMVVTYNGDFFDWPFVQTRAQYHGFDLLSETGITPDTYIGRWTVNLDAFHWVQRDSYLPQGAQGLKAVTKYKLGYDPVEVDPEDMVAAAQHEPVRMATYSVSDAVATYYLYEQYVHQFLFSLCTLIPLSPSDVLSKGSGTLCETLLLVQAAKYNVLSPNKQLDDPANHKFDAAGHYIESETYIGGKVECLETGVYRSDLQYDFACDSDAYLQLVENIDRDLTFAVTVEAGKSMDDIVNYQEVRDAIVKELHSLAEQPKRTEHPYIYHLDVGAMYPNIILTNRLQPTAVVDDATCAACDFNQSKNNCKRRMDWVYRYEHNPATKSEYDQIRDQLVRTTGEADPETVVQRLKQYSKTAYKKTKVVATETRTDTVCMRENSFYVDTVRQFRDRRYEYKALLKQWKRKGDTKEARDRVLVYDSLQVAHKCILNSFYGYVMRKGARWRSMEMAGIVTKLGADMILAARRLVERIGRPLELDTDGIWCILPKSFPDVYSMKCKDGSKVKIEYPCVMLNAMVNENFTNHQYQTAVDPTRGKYTTHSECSIFFEVDGPYRCMVLPSSTEEDKLLKKRYAVFNFDGSLAELKGFELKRRGELELIKTFQSQVFERFLDGTSLEECYASVADVANHWIDVIDTRGDSLEDDELVELISENRNMSRQLEDYGDQKGTSQTTARRLGEFLGAEIIKDKGLNCRFIVAEQPFGAPVTERAIPTAIWKAEESVMKHFLRKWLKAPGLDGDGLDMRNILDWGYYLERLGKNVQRIITIPAALQKIPNPVPRVGHPEWLETRVNRQKDKFQQQSIVNMFASANKRAAAVDMEDIGTSGNSAKRPIVHKFSRRPPMQPGAASTEPEKEDAIVPAERVRLSSEHFDEWLKQRKLSWRDARKGRRGSSRGTGISSRDVGKKQRKGVSVEGFVRDAAQSLTESEWQIVEVREMTTFDGLTSSSSGGSGEFVVWAMVGSSSLQKFVVSVPRTVYVTCNQEVAHSCSDFLDFRLVDKHLPYSKKCSFLYEITMHERVFRRMEWPQELEPLSPTDDKVIETMYESSTPLLMKALTQMGSVSSLTKSVKDKTSKTYSMSDILRVDRPLDGEYFHRNLDYKRVFLYVRLHPKTNSGMVALFTIDGGSGVFAGESETLDVTRPTEGSAGGFDVQASCEVWIVKPQTKRSQQGVTQKQCERLFDQLMSTIRQEAGLDSDYSCISSTSGIAMNNLHFVKSEVLAFAGANETINQEARSKGATFILLNSNRPAAMLRRHISTFGTCPVITLSFPPGPAHDPTSNSLPSLNWELPALQLSLEAYLYMMVVSFPKRVAYSRYGQVPVGNLNHDENTLVYDVSLARLIQKNRAISWASPSRRPDLGVNYYPYANGGSFPLTEDAGNKFTQEEIWGDDDELVSPVVREPGCYRSICIDIDLQDLAIASLTNTAAMGTGSSVDPHSPQSVTAFNSAFMTGSKLSTPLGDEMSTSISLSMVRALVSGWLKDAFTQNSLVADELLHHIYRLVSNPETLLHDPALHRVVHSLMKTTFRKLLGELKRLGCRVVFASFHKIIVATNKLEFSEAQEYIQFVLETVRKQVDGDDLAKLSLSPRQFHSHFVFLDEYNFGTMQLERLERSELDESIPWFYDDGENADAVIVPSVVTAWTLMDYLGSEMAQQYFRVIIGRFSKDVLRKQIEIASTEDVLPILGAPGLDEPVLAYKRKMISRHFAHDLTRAVSDIQRDEEASIENVALEFIKNVIAVLELDSDLEQQVQALKRSLLSQIGVAEYSNAAQWSNPCPSFVLTDVFCSDCQDSRDVNLCYNDWTCSDCGTPFDRPEMERRLLTGLEKKMIQYVSQDVRDKTNQRLSRRALATDCAMGVTMETTAGQVRKELEVLHNLAETHELESLRLAVHGILNNYAE